MKLIALTSKNRGKIEGTSIAFKRFFPEETFEIISYPPPSFHTKEGKLWFGDIKEQPRNESETIHGAFQRFHYLSNLLTEQKSDPLPDFLVSIEAGVAKHNDTLLSFSWAVVSHYGFKHSYGKSSSFILPPHIVEKINAGKTLSQACKETYPPEINPNAHDGLLSILSGGVFTRTDQSASAVMMALLEIKSRSLYQQNY